MSKTALLFPMLLDIVSEVSQNAWYIHGKGG